MLFRSKFINIQEDTTFIFPKSYTKLGARATFILAMYLINLPAMLQDMLLKKLMVRKAKNIMPSLTMMVLLLVINPKSFAILPTESKTKKLLVAVLVQLGLKNSISMSTLLTA